MPVGKADRQVTQVDAPTLATPVSAHAGLAIFSKHEFETFKHSGWKIIIIAILVFIGTYLIEDLEDEIGCSVRHLRLPGWIPIVGSLERPTLPSADRHPCEVPSSMAPT